MAKTNVLIVVPAYPGEVRPETMLSVDAAKTAIKATGADCNLLSSNWWDVADTRNNFGTMVLRQREITHLLFADNDIGFQPSQPLRLLKENKPFIGYCCTKRDFDKQKFYDAIKTGASFEKANALAHEYSIELEPGKTDIVNGTCKVGMGLTLLKREVFEKLDATGKLRTATSPDPKAVESTLVGFFDRMPLGNELLHEDVSFCKRWRELCSGEIWAIIDEKINHIGEMAYAANFLAAHGL